MILQAVLGRVKAAPMAGVLTALVVAIWPAPTGAQGGRAGWAPLLEGVALAVEGDPAAATARLEAIPAKARSAEVLSSLGILELARGRAADGEALLEQAVGADGTVAEAHYWLGIAALRRGQPAKAAAALESAVSLSKSPDYRLARGLARAATGRRAEAADDVAAAAGARLNLLLPTLHPDERRGLLRLAERALEGFPDATMVDDALTRLYHDAGLLREASDRAGDRRTGTALEVRGRIALSRDEALTAARLLRRAAAVSPGSASARFHLGRAEYQAGAATKALSAFQQAARLDPADPRIQVALGDLYLEQGDLDRAELAYEYAIVRQRTPAALGGLGRVRELRGDLEGAREHYEAAVTLAPASVTALERLAGLLDRQGEGRRARALRVRLKAAARVEEDLESRLEQTEAALDGHEAWCERLLRDPSAPEPEQGQELARGPVRHFARAGAMHRAGERESSRAAAALVLRRLRARQWADGAAPVVRVRHKISGAVVERAALLELVPFGL